MKNRKEQRQRRHQRLRQRVKGTAERPRMSICISNQHLYVQFIDDDAQCTLAAASTAGAEAALAKGLSRVVVDRGGFRYHGRVKELVEAAVAAGLSISDKDKTEEESK